jgi:hypothetical protein
MMHEALADARERNLQVVAGCTFVEHFLEEHTEYQDLVRTRRRSTGKSSSSRTTPPRAPHPVVPMPCSSSPRRGPGRRLPRANRLDLSDAGRDSAADRGVHREGAARDRPVPVEPGLPVRHRHLERANPVRAVAHARRRHRIGDQGDRPGAEAKTSRSIGSCT